MKFSGSEEVIELIKKNQQVPKWVQSAREYHKELKGLVYGEDFKDLLLKIEHIETEKRAKARRNFARPIKDINSKILEPISNVYSATGGGREYNIKSKAILNEFMRSISNIRGGLSLEKWLNEYWAKDLQIVDPSGIIFMEYTTGENSKTYPTYKSIDSIRNYEADGQNLEWVIFEPKQVIGGTDRIWRVVDKDRDYTVIQQGDHFTEDKIKSFDHPFGYVPARINSEKNRLGDKCRLSLLDDIIDAEKEFLRDRSILTIHKFLNGFATPYRPALVCPDCHGTKKNGDKKCDTCDGKGFLQKGDVVDEIIIPIDLTAENPVSLPTNFAGFISPDLEIWNQYRQEQKAIFNEMFEAIWGTRESNEVKDQTAMGQMLNLQPLEARLNKISDTAESQEHFFTEMVANFMMLEKNKQESISIVTYGRNYIIQPPSYLLKQYQESSAAKDSLTILDRKMKEYLTSKFKNDPSTLKTELIKKQLEPYIHYDIELVSKIYGSTEAMRKGLFVDWWDTLTSPDKQKTIQQLEEMQDTWMTEKIEIINNRKQVLPMPIPNQEDQTL